MGDYDRESVNNDGQIFYGYDDNGRTTWYDSDGNCDCQTSYYDSEDD